MAPRYLAPLRRPLRFLRRQLPPQNFITLHYAYFILTCLLSTIIFWGSSTPPRSISFTNSLFLVVSAMTEAGLNTVNLSELNTFQQILLFLLILLGSAIFVSAFVVGVRKRAFERKFIAVTRAQIARGQSREEQGIAPSTSDSVGLGEESAIANEQVEVNSGTQEEISEKSDDAVSGDNKSHAAIEAQHTSSAQENDLVKDLIARPASDPSRQVHIAFAEDQQVRRERRDQRGPSHSFLTMQGVGARRRASLPTVHSDERPIMTPVSIRRSGVHNTEFQKQTRTDEYGPYLPPLSRSISRNSQFHSLSQDERELLGGYEYRAVSLLGYLVPLYFVLWQLLGCLGCAAWVAYNASDTARRNGFNPWWLGAFNAVSAFNNSGMSLLDANMIAFQRSYYMLLTMGLLILAGNTAYPIFLRLTIWCLYKAVSKKAEGRPDHDPWVERARTLRFLLDHPRRCYTNLFPARHNWWLAFSVFTLNSVDWAAFEILNIGNHELDRGLPTRFRVIDGLFQALAVRSGGFYVVSIPTLRISLQVLYVVMMYISVYPVVITMRNSNVYEERSLGIYAEDDDNNDNENDPSSRSPKRQPRAENKPGLLRHLSHISNHFLGGSPEPTQESNSQFVRHQLRAQLAHDAWFIVLALFLIMICESSAFEKQPAVFSVFNFIFEIVSAYGCVGISVGVPYNSFSFCGAWNTLSKLILCAVMLRGRHRGLPVAIDKAVLLPSEMQGRAEEEDRRIRLERTTRRSQEALSPQAS